MDPKATPTYHPMAGCGLSRARQGGYDHIPARLIYEGNGMTWEIMYVLLYYVDKQTTGHMSSKVTGHISSKVKTSTVDTPATDFTSAQMGRVTSHRVETSTSHGTTARMERISSQSVDTSTTNYTTDENGKNTSYFNNDSSALLFETSMKTSSHIDSFTSSVVPGNYSVLHYIHINPSTAKLFNANFRPLEVVSRWQDPQL